jgi:hypothetical protein
VTVAAPSVQPVSDAHAPLATPQKLTTAQEVRLQLARDYPPGALSWVDEIQWAAKPQMVPLRQVDMTDGDTDWAAARKDKLKIAAFVSRLRAGVRKPIVLIRHPGSPKLFACDGHTRILASAALGQPVTAWVGTSKTDDGGWRTVHARKSN